MHRRAFVKYAAMGAVATASPGLLVDPSSASDSTTSSSPAPAIDGSAAVRRYSGADLDGWEETLGAGVWAAPGQAPVVRSDIESVHVGSHSSLRANVARRGVMAHNINVKRIVDPAAADHLHVGAFDFRLPYRPAPGAWPDNAQTVEGGLFVRDGNDTGCDYGLAFQWVLNPWLPGFGDVRCWTSMSGGAWSPSSTLTPDRRWHRIEFVLDVRNASASMTIDGVGIPVAFVADETPGRGDETAARLQAELISLWPGANPIAPSHRADFRNWTWDWHASPGA